MKIIRLIFRAALPFALTCAVGIGAEQVLERNRTHRSFTREEAMAKINHRVVCKYQVNGQAKEKHGTVIAITEIFGADPSISGYDLVVHYDEPVWYSNHDSLVDKDQFGKLIFEE